jgi:hypothetical protein
MIAAKDAAAIQQGDYQLVMGEMHMGVNTLNAALFVSQHPSPTEITQAVEKDIPEQRIIPIPPADWPSLTTRTSLSLISPKDIRIHLGTNVSRELAKDSLNIGDLLVERSGPDLQMGTRDGRYHIPLLEAFAEALSLLTVDLFQLVDQRPHIPRITIDKLTVMRETWNFSAEQLPFANEKQEEQRFAAANVWAQKHRLPRFIFVKTPVEPKPFYVDFASPVYIELFARAVRRTVAAGAHQLIRVSEMLPQPEQAWLNDAQGRHYTSEFRCIIVDTHPVAHQEVPDLRRSEKAPEQPQ